MRFNALEIKVSTVITKLEYLETKTEDRVYRHEVSRLMSELQIGNPNLNVPKLD